MEKTIQIAVHNKIAVKTCDTVYVCGNSDFSVHFTFDDEWAEHYSKTARFIANDGTYVDQPFSGDTCPVPILRNTYGFNVGVYAGNLSTTTPAYCPAKKSILCPGGVPKDPEPDVYNEIMEKLNDGSLQGKPGPSGDTHVFLVREITDGISDKTKEEAEAAAKAGKAVMLVTKYGEVYTYYGKEKIPGTNEYAQMFVMPITKASTGKRRSVIYLRADNALLRKSETPFTAVAENPLIIKTGDTETSYDGSEKKEIEISETVFAANVILDENYDLKLECTRKDIEEAVEAGKIVIMVMHVIGMTLLYMGKADNERTGDEQCPFFVAPVITNETSGFNSKNAVYVNSDNTLTWTTESPIHAITQKVLYIKTAEKNYYFNGSEDETIDLTNLGSGGGSGGTFETPTEEEILQALIDTDFLLAVTDSDGAILTDADGAILVM